MEDIDDAAFVWAPITGPAKQAWPVASGRIAAAVKALTLAQRMIELTDVIFDGRADDADTGTWYDFMTPKLLMACAGH